MSKYHESLFRSFVEIELFEPDDFLKIKETLTRIGVASRHTKTFYPSCHILYSSKRNKYFIVHFKELLALDGKCESIPDEDIRRRNSIASLIEKWGLCKIVSNNIDSQIPLDNLHILRYNEKKDWNIVPKYRLGNKD